MSCEFFKNGDLQTLVSNIGFSDIVIQICGIMAYSTTLFTHFTGFYDTLKESNFTWNVTECHNIWTADANNGTSCVVLSDLTGISTSSVGIFIHIMELVIAFKLIDGAEKRNEKYCHKWIVLTVLLTALESGINVGQLPTENNHWILVYAIPTIFYKLGACGVVKTYVTEVRRSKSLLSSKSSQTFQESEVVIDFGINDRDPLIT